MSIEKNIIGFECRMPLKPLQNSIETNYQINLDMSSLRFKTLS